MPKLLMLKGLPGSGKTTYAKSLEDYKRVNMDDLRRMLYDYNGKLSKSNERLMQTMRNNLIGNLLLQGVNVVVDDTNLHQKHAGTMKLLVNQHNQVILGGGMFSNTLERYDYEEKFIDTPLKDCIKNDLKRQHSVGKDVIMRMYNQFLKPKTLDRQWDLSLPSCILVDIDGTVAQMVTRGPYEWAKVGDDMPKLEIIELVRMYQDAGVHHIIFMSGRDEVCRAETTEWLVKNIGYISTDLFMRPEGDQRKDTIVKQELYEQHIKGKYNVHLVLDDRNCMVEHWRQQGFTCLQVDEGDF